VLVYRENIGEPPTNAQSFGQEALREREREREKGSGNVIEREVALSLSLPVPLGKEGIFF
jgi:hypothetical protein